MHSRKFKKYQYNMPLNGSSKVSESLDQEQRGGQMELTINISKDEESFTRDVFGLYLAKKAFMKKLIEIEMAEKMASDSTLEEETVEELSDRVKTSMYKKIKSL
jgi:hypothetical protein